MLPKQDQVSIQGQEIEISKPKDETEEWKSPNKSDEHSTEEEDCCDDGRIYIPTIKDRLIGSRSKIAIEQSIAEIRLDLQCAIKEAYDCGLLSQIGLIIIHLHYFMSEDLFDISERLEMSYDQIRREHRNALEALRGTKRLEGYGKK